MLVAVSLECYFIEIMIIKKNRLNMTFQVDEKQIEGLQTNKKRAVVKCCLHGSTF